MELHKYNVSDTFDFLIRSDLTTYLALGSKPGPKTGLMLDHRECKELGCNNHGFH